MFYRKILRPILFLFDPEDIHHIVIKGLAFVSAIPIFSHIIRWFCLVRDLRLSVTLGRLQLANPVGLSAGFDKYIQAPHAHAMVGYGFAELGSVTYSEQPGNPRPRLWRIPRDSGLIVYYGLSNYGAVKSEMRLKQIKNRRAPIGVSIAPTTGLSIDQMADDYIRSLLLLHPYADYITLNVSCPNVASCDVFSQVAFIRELIEKSMRVIRENNLQKDVFVKIGPDMDLNDVDQIVEACLTHGVTGIVATNLIKKRVGISPVSAPAQLDHPGGISGALLREKSNAVIKRVYQKSAGQLKVIGVGGIFCAQDAYEKIKLGASAVQVFTGYIYNGPLFIRQLNQNLLKLMCRDGHATIGEVVGVDAK